MNGSKAILKEFGFDIEDEQESIYPFSPVYKVDDYIVKQTQFPLAQANHLVNYTTHLKNNGIPIVTPVNLKSGNPKQIDDECYICYPFIDGRDYHGTNSEIVQAGDLLGRIHNLASTHNTFQLETYDVFDFYHHEVDHDVRNIEKFVNSYQMDSDTLSLKSLLHQAVDNQEQLKDMPLKWVETPHDYKGNNLIYNDAPVLIDPDNATWIPRTFDLALALLLFHNELSSAPDRVFTPVEWQLFLDGYRHHQTLTEAEIKAWNQTVYHVFLDEVMWLMAEVDEDWERPEQRALFGSVTSIIFNLENYTVG